MGYPKIDFSSSRNNQPKINFTQVKHALFNSLSNPFLHDASSTLKPGFWVLPVSATITYLQYILSYLHIQTTRVKYR